MSEFDIGGISFEGDSVAIQYIELPADVRVGGKVAKTHSLNVSLLHPDYREDADLVRRTIERMLKNILDDFESSEPFEGEPDDDDEIRGMGDG